MQWKKFELHTRAEATDLVVSVLVEQGIDGFEILDHRPLTEQEKKAMYVDILPDPVDDDGSAVIIFYMDSDTPQEEVCARLTQLTEALEELRSFTDIGTAQIVETTTEDQDWVNNWKAFFKPFSVDDILIKPTWEVADNAAEYQMVVEIDPGTAFGTGLHETTQLCIRQLRKYLKGGEKLLDVGCGSGILSIIGRKLGAGAVLGIDIDEAAVQASIENSKVNHVEELQFVCGNLLADKMLQEETGYEKYDVVVSNILADVIIPLADIIDSHMKPGALWITSGIIDTKEADVAAAIEKNPKLKILEITRQKDWVNITAVKCETSETDRS